MNRIWMLSLVLIFLLMGFSKTGICQSEPSIAEGKWIDLTHDFSEETIYWPTAEEFKLDSVFEGMTEKGYFYDANNYSAAEHGGTHIDSPIHFAEGKQTVDEIPIERLVGPAVVINVSEKALADPDYLVGVEDFTNWEKEHDEVPEGSIVLLNTGYAQFWPDRVKYMGTDKRGPEAVKDLHFPGLDPKAAEWLVENRSIKAIGLDTPSIDYGQSQLFESHRILFKENIPAFENVANLDKLPPKGAFVIALPMKIKRGSGGPLRIIANIPDKPVKE
jgi:kynurenine formamidase